MHSPHWTAAVSQKLKLHLRESNTVAVIVYTCNLSNLYSIATCFGSNVRAIASKNPGMHGGWSYTLGVDTNACVNDHSSGKKKAKLSRYR